jgi:hypothetical protein
MKSRWHQDRSQSDATEEKCEECGPLDPQGYPEGMTDPNNGKVEDREGDGTQHHFATPIWAIELNYGSLVGRLPRMVPARYLKLAFSGSLRVTEAAR